MRDSRKTERVLTEARKAEIKRQLLPLLIELLLSEDDGPVFLSSVLERLDPLMMKDALMFFKLEYFALDDEKGPRMLFEMLDEEGFVGPLTDEQEARISDRLSQRPMFGARS